MKMAWNLLYERQKDFMAVFIPMDFMIGKWYWQRIYVSFIFVHHFLWLWNWNEKEKNIHTHTKELPSRYVRVYLSGEKKFKHCLCNAHCHFLSLFICRCFFRGSGGTVNVLRISGTQGYPECGTQRVSTTILFFCRQKKVDQHTFELHTIMRCFQLYSTHFFFAALRLVEETLLCTSIYIIDIIVCFLLSLSWCCSCCLFISIRIYLFAILVRWHDDEYCGCAILR